MSGDFTPSVMESSGVRMTDSALANSLHTDSNNLNVAFNISEVCLYCFLKVLEGFGYGLFFGNSYPEFERFPKQRIQLLEQAAQSTYILLFAFHEHQRKLKIGSA